MRLCRCRNAGVVSRGVVRRMCATRKEVSAEPDTDRWIASRTRAGRVLGSVYSFASEREINRFRVITQKLNSLAVGWPGELACM